MPFISMHSFVALPFGLLFALPIATHAASTAPHEGGIKLAAAATSATGTRPINPGSSLQVAQASPESGETPQPQNSDAGQGGDEREVVTDPVEEVWDLVEQVAALVDDVLALEANISEARGEQRAVLLDQQKQNRKEAGDLFLTLIERIDELKDAGIDDRGAVTRAGDFLDDIAGWVDRRSEFLIAQLDELRAQRETATEAELDGIEKELVALDTEYDSLLTTSLGICQAHESLGLDPVDAYARLDRRVTARAQSRASQVRVARERIAQLTAQAAVGDKNEAVPLHAEMTQLKTRLSRRTDSLRAMVSLLEKRELPNSDYQQLLISATGEVTVDIFKREVAVGLLQQWVENVRAWAIASGPGILFKTLLALSILFASHIAGRIAQRLIGRGIESAKFPLSKLLETFLLATIYRMMLGLGLLIVLSQLGVRIGPLLAGLGVAGFIVGFALQDTLSNFASGMMILAYRPFDVGDIVKAGGVSGTVNQMTLVTTSILTFDNQRVIVPNTKLWGDVITNVTAETTRRIDLTFSIGYSDDIDRAAEILEEIARDHPLVLSKPEATIRLHELGESSIDFIVRPWAKTVDYWAVYWDITREVKRRFDAERISIPFPQRDVHLHTQSEDHEAS